MVKLRPQRRHFQKSEVNAKWYYTKTRLLYQFYCINYFDGRLVLLHPPEAALLAPAHRIKIDSAAGGAKVPDLVPPRKALVKQGLKACGICLESAIGKPQPEGYRIADASDLRPGLGKRGRIRRKGKRKDDSGKYVPEDFHKPSIPQPREIRKFEAGRVRL